MDRLGNKRRKRNQRKRRVRKKVFGTPKCPRLTVTKSLKNISVQVIDDEAGRTLVSVSTLEKELGKVKKGVEGAKTVGQKVGERLKAAKIKTIVFDRNGYPYHGIVKAVAEGAREAGIKF